MTMSTKYMDWADWAGDHHEEVEAERRKARIEQCEHAEIDNQGVCENCGIEVEGWEPDDAQLLTQFGTKVPAA
jgi:hypothetical protein